MLGSARFIACGGVAACLSSKSSNLTVLGLSGVLGFDGDCTFSLSRSTTSKGDRVRSCGVGVTGTSGIGTSGTYDGVIGVFSESVVVGVVDVRRVICGSALLDVEVAGAPGGAGGAGGVCDAGTCSSSSMVSSCCLSMELMSPSGSIANLRLGDAACCGSCVEGREVPDGLGRVGAVGGAGGSCGGSGGLLNGSSGGGSSGGFGTERGERIRGILMSGSG